MLKFVRILIVLSIITVFIVGCALLPFLGWWAFVPMFGYIFIAMYLLNQFPHENSFWDHRR